MSVVAAAIVTSAAVGYAGSRAAGKAQERAAGKAADSQLQSTRENIDFQKEVFEQQRADQAPWREAGQQALMQLQQGLAAGEFDPRNFDFQADPGYRFRMQEGINALDSSAAARGRLQSGAQARATTRYASNLASQEYQNAFNRNLATQGTRFNQLASMAGVGQTAVNATQQAGQQMAGSVGNAIMAGGQAQAQGYINAGNAQAGAYQGAATAANQGISNFLTAKIGGVEMFGGG